MFSNGNKYHSAIHMAFLPKMKFDVLLFYLESMCFPKRKQEKIYRERVKTPIISPPITDMTLFPFQLGPRAETCFFWSEMQCVYNSVACFYFNIIL